MPSFFGNPKGPASGSPDQLHKGSFRADDLELQIAGEAAGALVQQVQFTCTRQINMIYEIGSTNVYYVGNRRQGQAQLSRIVGGSSTMSALLKTYGNMCKPEPLELKASGGCGEADGDGISYKLMAATLTSVGASVTAQDIVITESLGFIFADLDIQQAGGE